MDGDAGVDHGAARPARLSDDELDELAREIRDLLVRTCSSRGGHLGPNLGVVELTLAHAPRLRLARTTGSSSTPATRPTCTRCSPARRRSSTRCAPRTGSSGYPSQAESAHDVVENSHASTALSYADGLAKAYAIRGEDRHVVAVIGDGALTGGMAWEALNNIAVDAGTPSSGGSSSWSTTTAAPTPRPSAGSPTTSPRCAPTRATSRCSTRSSGACNGVPGVGPAVYDALHAVKKGMKDALAPQGLFEDLGLKYVGPVDGHDRVAVEHALTQAKRFDGPVIVHALTRKGFGYDAAEQHEADQFHSPGPFDVATGEEVARGLIWTDVFADEMVADRRASGPTSSRSPRPCCTRSASTRSPRRFPDRTFDVGIAEQHAATSAAGLAMGGLHPVVAIYATFLNRAFDQVLMDVALHRCGVTFVLDRAGVTGDDGASHNGMWDMSVLQVVPGPAARRAARRHPAPRAAQRGGQRRRRPDRRALPQGPAAAPTSRRSAASAAATSWSATGAKDVLLVAVGAMAATCVEVAERLVAQGIGVTVVDPRWVKPVDPALVELAREHRLVVSVEDNGVVGGCGSVLLQTLNEERVDDPGAAARHPPALPRPRQAGRDPGAGRARPRRCSPAASSRTSPRSTAATRPRRRRT